ncbi:type II toxin-antitoxin system HicB family antitoxin [Desulfotomaculum copahuensis]|uniref:DNA repair protein n=1 Tax=Desulfotomaculum copahuensis TaxID=1838280 RepID=A0A1B7LC92_9FIRM|nr:toxin-antitoxin system HicB family antitoxin [Desulfotomaculum copahuensis]OAT80357.1 DNA repair protein [Desulfotomaculum copahuensis]
MSKKDLQYYLALPYRMAITPAEEGGYVVSIPALTGCISQGETVEEAIKMIEDAKKCWLEVALAEGIPIPEPTDEEYSGKFNVRVPKSLHRILVEKAKEENVSLNQYINYQLSRGVGYKTH